ncbi:MAG: lipid-A-disaccharide synthase [candidate division Zixibacteria bacterium]|nr:lipid-A-disaccharide synthase [candidate division Zixibacteria bacterium]
MGKPVFFISAGDPSGDNAAGHFITALKKINPDLEFFGLGGSRLKKLGQTQLARPGDLAVLGFWEVARRYFFFRKLFYRCMTEIKSRRPAFVLLVDYPGFNLRLAKKIKPLGIPVIYYISPQIWAWGKGRIKQIDRLVNLMLYILPFEESVYCESEVAREFVGHYLLDDISREYIKSPLPGNNQVALMPGSRPQEIARMLRPMLEAVRLLREKYDIKAVVAGVKDGYDYESVLQDYENIGLSYDDSRRTIYESQLVLTSSGTATLETGIIGRPMVVVYKTGFITYHIARRLVKLDMIGLVNLVQGEKVVPELIQGEANPEKMAAALEKYLTDTAYTERVKQKLDRTTDILGGPGASQRTAVIINEYL